jgi:DNA-binding transcriptional LysR family regulator
VRHTLQSNQTFDPASDAREFAIGSADYTSFILLPHLLAHCQTAAPRLNFRMMEFAKDRVGEVLEKGAIDLALGVFPNPPRNTMSTPLFQEYFVGIARKNHPVLMQQPISLEAFANLPHALHTIRQDVTGEVDRALTEHGLQRRVALTVPHLLVLPSIIATTDLITAIPSRMAYYCSKLDEIEIFELPLELPTWTVSLLWSQLSDNDDANRWLRQTLQTLCEVL